MNQRNELTCVYAWEKYITDNLLIAYLKLKHISMAFKLLIMFRAIDLKASKTTTNQPRGHQTQSAFDTFEGETIFLQHKPLFSWWELAPRRDEKKQEEQTEPTDWTK